MRSPHVIRLVLSIFLVLISSQVQGQPIIETVAGGGPNNMPALSANVDGPHAVAVDDSGSFYIASRSSHRVFKVDASGLLTIVAGNGLPAFRGDGGPATSASLNEPTDVVLDAAGNLFIADTLNVRIRRVDAATGVISTVAGDWYGGSLGDGGLANDASLGFPTGLALDTSGNLFIANVFGQRIRRVDAATGIITTVAGNGAKGFSGDGGPAVNANLRNPWAVALDAAGNLFIGDTGNVRIRRVDAATGIISTVAGNGVFDSSGDGGLATRASLAGSTGIAVDAANNLLIAESGGSAIRRVDAATGIISTIAGNGINGSDGDGGSATSARLGVPRDVAIDAAGNMFIAEFGAQHIRRVAASTGIINTVAGNGGRTLSGDGGPGTNASLDRPGSVAFDAAGNLFIADSGNRRIRRIDAATGSITTVVGNSPPITADPGDVGPASEAKFSVPVGVAFDTAGNLFITDAGADFILRVDVDTDIISPVAGNGRSGFSGDGGLSTSASLNNPWAVALDASGNLFIADTSNHRIRRVDSATGVISTVAGNGVNGFAGDGGPAISASLAFPRGVAVDVAGDIFIADTVNQRIRRVDSTTGIISTVVGRSRPGSGGDCGPALRASLNRPWAVAFDAVGNLFIADELNNRIRRVSAATGVISTVAGNGVFSFSGDGGPATAAGLAEPLGVALDAAGNLFIADFGSGRIRRVLLEGQADVTDSLFSLRRCSGTPPGRSRRTRQDALSR